MFIFVLGFRIFIKVSIENLHTGAILAFIEFLAINDSSKSSIANKVLAINGILDLHDFSVYVCDKVKLFLRSVQINSPLTSSKMSL